MSSIKKYTEGQWKKFAETNKNAKNLTTIVDGKEVSIEQAIQNLANDTTSLKRNVAWLALHGGGGSGGSGPTTRSASATIKVNSRQNGSQFAIVSGKPLIVSLENIYPRNSTESWKVTVSIGSLSKEYSLSNSKPSQEIAYYLFSDQLSDESTTTVEIKATYNDEVNGITGNAYWLGYIYIATIGIETQLDAQYPKADILKDESVFKVNVRTPLTSPLECSTTVYDGEQKYQKEFGEAPDHGKSWTLKLKDVFGYDEVAKTWQIEPDVGLYPVDVTVQTEEEGTVISQTVQIQIKVTAVGQIALSITGISKVISSPTTLTETSLNLKFAAEAFLDGHTSYSLSAFHNGNVIWQTTNDYFYSSSVSKNSYTSYISLDPTEFVVSEDPYTIEFIAKDRDGGQGGTEIVGTSKNYVKIVKASNNYLVLDGNTLSSQFVGIYAGSSTKYGTHLNQFNTLVPHMELTSNLPLVGDGVVSVDFNYINNSSKVTKDDSYLDSLRIANGTFFTIEPVVYGKSTVNLRTLKEWTIGITLRSDKYLTDENILFLYGYYDGTNPVGIVVKPHGIYLYNSSFKPTGYKQVVKLTDETPNIIHFVYSNGSDTTGSWDDSSEKSFFKIYLNGVLSFIDNKCPFSVSDEGLIQNYLQFKMYIGGIDKKLGKFGNVNLYSIEMFRNRLNELGLIVSKTNSKIMTTAALDSTASWSPDFSQKDIELTANFCKEDPETKEISSIIYSSASDGSKDSSTFNFQNLYLGKLEGDLEVYSYAPPVNYDTWTKYQYQQEIQSIPFPLVFLDVSSEPLWTFDNFKMKMTGSNHPLAGREAAASFWYWDPKKTKYAITKSGLTVKLQGTSTLVDFVKNMNISFPKTSKQETMFFVNDRWIPENTYTLKADVVDSSHSNNASIGTFINNVCGVHEVSGTYVTNGYDFTFERTAMNNVDATKSILNEKIVDKDGNALLSAVSVKHTVEGFPVLMLMRFHNQDDNYFKVLGIYSFNLGRDAIRNVGFKSITGLSAISQSISCLPAIADYEVKESETDVGFWIERSEDGDVDLSSIPNDVITIPSDISSHAGSFWQSDDSIVDHIFETRFSNLKGTSEGAKYAKPTEHVVFKNFLSTIQKLPIEGTLHYSNGFEQKDVYGTYDGYKWTTDGGYVKDADMTMNGSVVESTIGNFINYEEVAKYSAIAMLFGLRDNFDKNITYRSWNNNPCRVDFYDMDTALGLTNQGEELQNPIMMFKYLVNEINTANMPVARETYQPTQLDESLKSEIILPESVGNKLMYSFDTQAMRSYFKYEYSYLTTQWFRFREVIEKIAQTAGYSNFVEYFIEEYFEKQTRLCGQMFFNYDYKIKYINSFEKADTVPRGEDTTFRKCHGRRIEYIRQWLTDHLIFLDSYFYWRGHFSYGDPSVVQLQYLYGPMHTNRVLALKHTNTATGNYYTTMMSQYNNLIWCYKDQTETTPTFLVKNKETKVYIPMNGSPTGATAGISHANTLISADWNRMKIVQFSRGENLDSMYNLNNFEFNGNMMTKFDQSLFYKGTDNQYTISQLKSLNLSGYSSSGTITNIDISPQTYGSETVNVFKNMQDVNIEDSTQIGTLKLSDIPLRSLNVKNSTINKLKIDGQPYISVPDITGCSSLVELNVNNCVLAADETYPSSFVTYNIAGQNNLTSLIIQKCSTLKAITLSACQNLQKVVLNECSGLTAVNIISCQSLTAEDDVQIINDQDLVSMELQYCKNLTCFTFQHSYPEKLKTLNLQGAALKQIKLKVGSETEFTKTSKGSVPVLDLKAFTKTKFTLSDNKNVEAIRFSNIKEQPIALPDVGTWGINNSNLKYVYGHVALDGNGFSRIPCSFFTGEATNKIKDYEATYSSGQTVWENCGMENSEWSNMLSAFEIVNAKIGGKTYHLPFLKKDYNATELKLKRFNDFTPSEDVGTPSEPGYIKGDEWARNYSIIGKPYFYGNASNAMSMKDVNYALFKVAVWNYFVGQEGFGSKITSLDSAFQAIKVNGTLTDYAFKGLGDITSMKSTFANNSFRSQIITKNMLSCVPRLNAYDYMFGANDVVITCTYDAFEANTALTYFGNTSDHAYDKLKLKESGNEGEFFKNCNNLTYITHFNIENCDYGNLVFPTSLTSIEKSFNGDTACIIDLPTMFKPRSQIQKIDQAFTGQNLSVIYRPSTFANMKRLQEIGTVGSNGEMTYALYNSDANRYVVLDRYYNNNKSQFFNFDKNNIDDYLSAGSSLAGPVKLTYTTNDWKNFLSGFLSSQTQLQTFNCVLANCDITSLNTLSANLTFPGNLFDKTINIVNIPYGMYNFRHLYGLTESGFKNCHNLGKVTSLFQQDLKKTASTNSMGNNVQIVSPYVGISSDIPYKLFYHGSTTTNITINGVNGASMMPPTSQEVINAKNVALTSESFSDYKTAVSAMMLMDNSVFTALSTKYSGGETWYDFSNHIDDLKDTFQSVTYLTAEPGGELTVVVRSDPPYPTIYKTLTAVADVLSTEELIRANLYVDILGMQSTSHARTEYNKNIYDIDRCFYGNGSIKAYDGPKDPTTEELNEDYHPYDYEYDGTTWKKIIEKDLFKYDDSWFYNGEVWSDAAQTTIAYNPLHKNIVNSDMSALIFTQEYELSNATGENETYKEKKCFVYNADNCKTRNMKFVCAPDLLRYVANNKDTNLTAMFKATSNEYFDIDLKSKSSSVTQEMKKSTYCGIKGRIPSILFKPVSNVIDIREFFRDCKYINGYLQKSSDGTTVVCKYIPDELFSYFDNSLKSMQYMFYNNVMPMSEVAGHYDLDLVTPFRNMTSDNQRYKDVSAIFGKCQWLNGNIIRDVFKTVFLEGAYGAFSRRPLEGTIVDGYLEPTNTYYGSATHDDGWSIKKHGDMNLANNQLSVISAGEKIVVTAVLSVGSNMFDTNTFDGGTPDMKQFAVYTSQVKGDNRDIVFEGSMRHPYDYKY